MHDYIVMPLELNQLIDTPFVQRLRFISQTAQASSVFPAMSGYRFEHSLGTMHLARSAWITMWSRTEGSVRDAFMDDAFHYLSRRPKDIDDFTRAWIINPSKFKAEFEKNVAVAVAAAALLHDVGHPPFSHSLEDFYERNINLVTTGGYVDVVRSNHWSSPLGAPFHERIGNALLESIPLSVVDGFSWYVTKQILNAGDTDTTWLGALHHLISSEVDVDRIDYLVRDAKRAGTEFGSFDMARLLQSLELHEMTGTEVPKSGERAWRIGLGYRARTAAESFLTNRLRYYQWVLFHPHVVASNRMLDIALQELVEICALSYRAGASKADRAVGGVLNSLVPNLTYFSAPVVKDVKRDESNDSHLFDDQALHLNAEVDDATILEWMKRSASACRALLRDRQVSSKVHSRLARYLALYNALHFRVPNWAPVWKTEDDYGRLARDMAPKLTETIDLQLEEISRRLSDGSLDESFTSMSSELSRIAPLLDSTGPPDRFSPAEGLNRLADLALSHREPSQRFRSLEKMGEILTTATRSETGVIGDGEWLFAYQSVSPLRVGNKEIMLWKLDTRTPLSSMSAMARSLPSVASGYPRLFAYFLSYHRSDVRTGRDSPHSSDLKRVFEKYFPVCLAEFLAGS